MKTLSLIVHIMFKYAYLLCQTHD